MLIEYHKIASNLPVTLLHFMSPYRPANGGVMNAKGLRDDAFIGQSPKAASASTASGKTVLEKRRSLQGLVFRFAPGVCL